MIEKDICPECQGFGHKPDCACRDAVAFVVGCCDNCGGEGFVTRKIEGLVDAYGNKHTTKASSER